MHNRHEVFKRLLKRILRILGKIVMPVNQNLNQNPSRSQNQNQKNQNHSLAGAGLQTRTMSNRKLGSHQQNVLLETFLVQHLLLQQILDAMHRQMLICHEE